MKTAPDPVFLPWTWIRTIRNPFCFSVAFRGSYRAHDRPGEWAVHAILVPGSTIGITDSGGDDRIDLGTSTQQITANIGTTETIVTDEDGDVYFTGTLEGIGGTTGDDTYTDGTTVDEPAITDPDRDDTYQALRVSLVTLSLPNNGSNWASITVAPPLRPGGGRFKGVR